MKGLAKKICQKTIYGRIIDFGNYYEKSISEWWEITFNPRRTDKIKIDVSL